MTRPSAWRPWRLLLPLAALLALGYLAAMVAIGAMPVQRQLVRFEARGVLTMPAEAVRRVRIAAGERSVELLRRGDGGWTRAGGPPDASIASDAGIASQAETALKVLQRSGPVREIEAAELAGVDVRALGLDDPALVLEVYADGAEPALTARFGGYNPEGILQYMRLDGDPRVYLMSRFVAGEWRSTLDAAAP